MLHCALFPRPVQLPPIGLPPPPPLVKGLLLYQTNWCEACRKWVGSLRLTSQNKPVLLSRMQSQRVPADGEPFSDHVPFCMARGWPSEPSRVKSKPAIPVPILLKVPARAKASRPCQASCTVPQSLAAQSMVLQTTLLAQVVPVRLLHQSIPVSFKRPVAGKVAVLSSAAVWLVAPALSVTVRRMVRNPGTVNCLI